MNTINRKLLVLVWLSMAPVAVGAEPPPSGGAEDQAVAKIREAGGTVRQVAQNVEWKEVSFALSNQPVTDDALAPLPAVQHLTWLYLQGTDISDEGLQHLAGLTELTKLHLERTKITDAGLKYLQGLENLEYLNLYGTQVTDEGLRQLTGLKRLRKLYLWQTRVTEAGMQKLREALPDALIMAAARPLTSEAAKPIEPLAEGRYLRVRLQGEDKILSLAEVEVHQAGDATPLQSEATASQSSVAYGGAPERAHDGNTSADYNDNSVTHTDSESYPWWQWDLGVTKAIGRIKIWNRADGCGSRLEGAVVELLDDEHQIVWSGLIREAKDASTHEFSSE